MLLLTDFSIGDQEQPLTKEKITEQSELVLEGKVEKLTVTKEESITLEKDPKNPVKITYYEVIMTVENFIAKNKSMKSYNKPTVVLYFKNVDNARYEGDSISKLEKGKSYIIYGRVVRSRKDGIAEIYIHTPNEVVVASVTPRN